MWSDFCDIPKISEAAKTGSFYKISTDKILGYFSKYSFTNIISFSKWLIKNAKDKKNLLHKNFDYIILQYIRNGKFKVFLVPEVLIIYRENDDDFYLNKGIILQSGLKLHRDIKEVNEEEIAEIFDSELKEKYFIKYFSIFAKEAAVIKSEIDKKFKEVSISYLEEKKKNVNRGNELIFKHNNKNRNI